MNTQKTASSPSRQIAVVGAGIAGIACARTLDRAGHRVTMFEAESNVGGRTASVHTPFGSFDAGAQYFTVRDARLRQALDTVPGLCRAWSANAVRVLDAHGHLIEAGRPGGESHWVARPAMDALAQAWAEPLRARGGLACGTRVTRLVPDALDPTRWQLELEGPDSAARVQAGFDAVLLALPAPQASALLAAAPRAAEVAAGLDRVRIDPCWTLMLAFPNALQPGAGGFGPQWNAAFSTHHRIAWLARESSKPGREAIERWTVQAGPEWSLEHRGDDPARVAGKLGRAFTEITGIRAEAAHAEVRLWPYARTTAPLGHTHRWDAGLGLGLCGDWCLGHRVEDAFLSGLSLALAVAGRA